MLVEVVPNSLLDGESPSTKSIARCQFKGKGGTAASFSKIYCKQPQWSFSWVILMPTESGRVAFFLSQDKMYILNS